MTSDLTLVRDASEVSGTLTYLAFCTSIGVKLTRAQTVIAGIEYDGIEPEELLVPRDRELAREIFGDVDRFPPGVRRVALNLCGARGGKSYVLIALRLVHLALTVPLDGQLGGKKLAPNEIASALIVAPDISLAMQTYRFAVGAVEHPLIRDRLIGKPTKKSFMLARENGHRVVVECLPASVGGSSLRARNYVGAGFDEFAFFHDGDFKVNDADIFQAVMPRILPGGQGVICSTPWARKGLMYELHRENWAHPKTLIASTATTVMMNPAKRDEIAMERLRDEENCKREFECVFMDSAGVMFFSHDAIDRSVRDTVAMGLKWPIPFLDGSGKPGPPPGSEIMIGADLGFRRDSSAIVAVYKLHTGEFVVADVLELKPHPGIPLKPSEVIEAFAAFCKKHQASWLMADQHYVDSLSEELAKQGLSVVPAPTGAAGKAESHVHARTILNSQKFRINPQEKRLIQQMRDIVSRPTAGGGITLQVPRTATGGHGDVLSALVLALSQRAGQRARDLLPEKPITIEEAIKKQTAEVWRRYETKRLDALAEVVEAEHDRGETMAQQLNPFWTNPEDDRNPWG